MVFKMQYCTKCVYPIVSATPLSLNSSGICTGCELSQTKHDIDWSLRWKQLVELTEQYKDKNYYDILIPVSGGKDSYFQTHIAVEKLKLKPLLVTYHGNNYSKKGEENLNNMRRVFDCDHVIFKPSEKVLIKLNRLGFKIDGDMNWHNHCGIFTYPIQLACKFNIPLILWGEHGFMDIGGMYSYDDYVEFTAKHRKEHSLHGLDWYDFVKVTSKYSPLISDNEILTEKDISWAKYPNDNEIIKNKVRGIYLSNYVNWDGNKNASLMKELYGWQESNIEYERTYRSISNLDDIHENGIHDYMKFIKFGYGRTTDHASKDIRAGKMSREEGIYEVMKRDHIKSKDLNRWLSYVNMTENDFDKIADTFRDKRVWFIKDGYWYKNNLDGSVTNYGTVKLPKEKQKDYLR
tara:strand:- start:659 stop:1873 length:1215 start_codon:yes stop_codon:yes gene_type:complete